MLLKCIGGECDGEHKNVDDYYKVGDQIRVMGKMKYDLPDFSQEVKDWREGKVPDYMTIKYYLYKIECIHFSKDDRVLFLIPTDWTTKQALMPLLTCS